MPLSSRRTALAAALGLVLAAGAWATSLRGADHIDAPATTADAPADINDMFVFRSPADPSRVVFALTAHPLIPPAEAASVRFPTDVLYQWKIDTNGDAVEDLVLQARVVAEQDGRQIVVVRGPAAPARTGAMTTELAGPPLASGPVSGVSETAVLEGRDGVRVFAGVRDDPFYVDLARLLDILAGNESSFRDPGVDALAGVNTLAIVVELPSALLGDATQLAVWATSSRSN